MEQQPKIYSQMTFEFHQKPTVNPKTLESTAQMSNIKAIKFLALGQPECYLYSNWQHNLEYC
jgi:hypothetical protein